MSFLFFCVCLIYQSCMFVLLVMPHVGPMIRQYNIFYSILYMMQISSMYIGHEEDFNFILFNHFQSKCPLDTGP